MRPAPPSQVDQADLDAAVTDYQTYVLAQTEALATNTKKFTDAVRAGDIEQAKAALRRGPGAVGGRSSRSPSCSPTPTR